MKRLIYTLLAVSIIFSACKKEDEDNAFTGVWVFSFEVTDTTQIRVSADGTLSGELIWLDSPGNITGSVTNNGTLTGEATVTYYITGDQIPFLFNGTLSGNNGSGTLTGDGDDQYLEQWSAVKQ